MKKLVHVVLLLGVAAAMLGALAGCGKDAALVTGPGNDASSLAGLHATAAELVKANGGQILNGPMELPDGDWIANAMDPQGAAFSLHATKPA